MIRTTRQVAEMMCYAILGLVLVTSSAIAEDDKAKETKKVEVGDITLEVPTDWKQQEPTSRLRAGQFLIPAVEGDEEPAELVIFYFRGGGGGDKVNIERWIQQFQGEEREFQLSEGTSSQGDYLLADLSGTYNKPIGPPIQQKTEAAPGYRMLGVILRVKDKGNYYLKLTGPEKTVATVAEDLRSSLGAKMADEKELDLDQVKE